MESFTSVDDMLLSGVFPLIAGNREQYYNNSNKLTISTSCFENREDIIFCKNKLGVDFSEMKIIVNPLMWKILPDISYLDPNAYLKIARHAIWRGIDCCTINQDPIELAPISYITMDTVFSDKGKHPVSFTDIINHCTWEKSNRHMLILLSSNTRVGVNDELINAIATFSKKYSCADIHQFIVGEGCYYGFIAVF